MQSSRRRGARLALTALLAGAAAHASHAAHAGTDPTSTATRPAVRGAAAPEASYLAPPLAFEANRGQTDPRVRFLAAGEGYRLFLTAGEAVLALRAPGTAAPVSQIASPGGRPAAWRPARPGSPPAGIDGKRLAKRGEPDERILRLRFLGTRSEVAATGEGELPSRTHYLVGRDPGAWRRDVPSYERVRYTGLYPGIDLVFYGNQRRLEHDFLLAPGADPRAIRLAVEGADRVVVDRSGDLVLAAGGAEVRLRRPVAYQEVGGRRREVACAFRLLPAPGGGREVGFALGPYRPGAPLVIDPVLDYSTYLGGSGGDGANAVAVDAAGNAYVTGLAGAQDFPGATYPIPNRAADYDVFVAKYDPEGRLLFTTIFGGRYYDEGLDVAVDGQGRIYLVGFTVSRDFADPDFEYPPDEPGEPEDAFHYGAGFAAALDESGSSVLYSETFSVREESANYFKIAVTPEGNAYYIGEAGPHHVTGIGSFSLDGPAAPVGPIDPPCPDLGVLYPWGLATDPAGNLYVAGWGNSFDDTYAFVVKLGGGVPLYSRCLAGGSLALAVAADPAGNAYVTGQTGGLDTVLGAVQPTYGGGGDAFVVKLDPAGEVVYSSYLGGAGEDGGLGIAVDAGGGAHVSGYTHSTDFPRRDPLPSRCTPGPAFTQACRFVTRLTPAGNRFEVSTLFGRTGDSVLSEVGEPVGADARGATFLVGSTGPDLPLRNAAQPTSGGGSDAFVLKIAASNRPPDCSAARARPATTAWPPNGRLVPIEIDGITDPEGETIELTVDSVFQDEPTGGVASAFGVRTRNVRVRATRAETGDGRVYHLRFTAADPHRANCRGEVTVCVPKERGGTCGDGGRRFDSTKGAAGPP